MTITEAPARSIRCGNDRNHVHATSYEVFCCYVQAGKVEGAWPCSWLIEDTRYVATGDPDEPYYADRGVFECGLPTRERADGTGYDCDGGHEHTYDQARHDQGWDYAADPGEAALLARYGTEPRHLDGKVWIEPLPHA